MALHFILTEILFYQLKNILFSKVLLKNILLSDTSANLIQHLFLIIMMHTLIKTLPPHLKPNLKLRVILSTHTPTLKLSHNPI